MEVIAPKAAMRRWSRACRRAEETVALVPTMGYLHEGHLSLVKQAKRRADRVVVSIYVNPTQFAHHEDFAEYPRDTERDLNALRDLGVDACFLPSELYVDGQSPDTWVIPGTLAAPLCGASRPTFFRGVSTVVSKLFHIVEPDLAVFGEKDFQQLRVIQRMVMDLDMSVEIIPMPIVREEGGLAMSSRNARLSAEARQQALVLPRCLSHMTDVVQQGQRDVTTLRREAIEALESAGA